MEQPSKYVACGGVSESMHAEKVTIGSQIVTRAWFKKSNVALVLAFSISLLITLCFLQEVKWWDSATYES